MSAADEIRDAYKPLRRALSPDLRRAFDELLRVIVSHLPDDDEDNPFADRSVYGETRSQCSECDGPIMREYDGNSSCDLCILKAQVNQIDDDTEELHSQLQDVEYCANSARDAADEAMKFALCAGDEASSHSCDWDEDRIRDLENSSGYCSHSDAEDLRVRNRLAALEKQIAILAAKLEEKEPTR